LGEKRRSSDTVQEGVGNRRERTKSGNVQLGNEKKKKGIKEKRQR